MPKSGQRHYLLLYARQLARWRAPAFLIAVMFGILWWFAQIIPQLASELGQAALAVGAIAAAGLFLYTLIAPRLAYVQCFPDYLRLNTPFLRVVMSYSRIRTVRPVQFTPTKLNDNQRDLLKPFLGQTILAVDLNSYPLGERWLRFWLHRFMFPESFAGLQFHVKDWMALSREIDSYRSLRKTSQVDTPSINPFNYH